MSPPAAEVPRWLALCRPLTKASEGCRLDAYQDAGGVWTIGYGCTGPDIVEGLTWTQGQADAELTARLHAHNHELTRAVRVRLKPNQRAALVDFAYNVGDRALLSSTLLRVLNAGDYMDVPAQFLRWKYDGGKILPGLVTRRKREARLFSTGAWA